MLKPIHRVACSPALAACKAMMQRFALWLCDPAITSVELTQAGLQPPVLASAIEANWLWAFLQKIDSGHSLLSYAETLADMPDPEKRALSAWVNAVATLSVQFQPAPLPWPINRPTISDAAWKAFKALMEAFYEKAFKSAGGLPFLANGGPTSAGGVTYATYVRVFRGAHRLSNHPDAREVCVMCGGPLGDTPHVDHWIIKSVFPLLSVCADNLQLICSTCNEAPNKGDKPVYSNSNFADWFHPYLRPGYGSVQPVYVLQEMVVRCQSPHVVDQPKAESLNRLLNLASRWTKEFKAEYANRQNVLCRRERQRIKQAQGRHTQAEIQAYVQQWQIDLADCEPHHEVHQTLAMALQEPTRLAAWHSELALVN